MNFDTYQEETKSTAIYPDSDIGGLNYALLGLANEAGEVLGKWKKIIRDKQAQVNNEDRLDIADELGDVLWYLSQAATELNVDLGLIAENNLEKLSDRASRGVLGGSGDKR